MGVRIKDFLLHLRLNYQLFILSGAFLAGGLFAPRVSAELFLLQFLNVHILLFGGVTAYNSFWDKDEGPIGGLKHPPKMQPWMLAMSWLIQVAGLFLAMLSGLYFLLTYIAAMLFFWLYSSPAARWKGNPYLSLVAIGISTGVCSFLMGYFAYGGSALKLSNALGAIGMACVLVSLFPLSQIYQVAEDRRRGDITFAARYGQRGVHLLFLILFPLGVLLLGVGLFAWNKLLGIVFLLGGLVFGLFIWRSLRAIQPEQEEYANVMRIKYVAGSAFAIIMLALLLLT